MSSVPPAPRTSSAAPKLLDRVRAAIRLRHYSRHTEESYLVWIRRYILYHGKRHPSEMGAREIAAFLSHLAVRRHVSSSTQNQALSAIVFLYRHVLKQEVGTLDGLVWAKRAKRLPVVLTRDEVGRVLGELDGVPHLIVTLLYGAGLRVSECVALRVKDVDFGMRQIVVRDGKGDVDRVTMVPAVALGPLTSHLAAVRRLHERDVSRGLGRVVLPDAVGVKYPNAALSWPWQFVFPAARVCRDPRWGPPTRFHLHESVVQKAVADAARRAGLTKRVGPHVMRHSFATHLVADGYDIRTVQQLLGHRDVRTTMVYTHVLNRGGLGVRSPADQLGLPVRVRRGVVPGVEPPDGEGPAGGAP
jgi:integron integrase